MNVASIFVDDSLAPGVAVESILSRNVSPTFPSANFSGCITHPLFSSFCQEFTMIISGLAREKPRTNRSKETRPNQPRVNRDHVGLSIRGLTTPSLVFLIIERDSLRRPLIFSLPSRLSLSLSLYLSHREATDRFCPTKRPVSSTADGLGMKFHRCAISHGFLPVPPCRKTNSGRVSIERSSGRVSGL